MQYHPIPVTSFPPEFVPGRDFYISAEQAAAGLALHAAGPKNEHILTCAAVPVRHLAYSAARYRAVTRRLRLFVPCDLPGLRQTHCVLASLQIPASGMFVRLQESCIAQMAPFVLAVLRAHVAGTLEGGFDGRYSAGPLDLTAFLASPANAAAVDRAVAARQARVSQAGAAPAPRSVHLPFVLQVQQPSPPRLP